MKHCEIEVISLVRKKFNFLGIDNFIRKIVFYLNKEKEKNFSLSIVFLGKDRMKNLNNLYRKINKDTDVLSFGWWEEKNISVGEIFISRAKLENQAKRYNHLISDELKVLLVHGILHLFGFEHIKESDSKEMSILENQLLKKIGLIERS